MEIASERRPARFDREKLAAKFWIFVWVVPLTLAIWIWAEREQVLYPTSPNLINIPILIKSDHRHIEPFNSDQQSVNLKVSGTQDAIDRVRQVLAEGVPHGIQIDIGDPPVGDKQPVDIVDHIQNYELFKQAGVTVEESQPAAVLINVDTIETRTVDVQTSAEVTAHLDGAAVFVPARVQVIGPTSLFAALEKDGALKVQADVAYNADLAVPGEHNFAKVPVKIIGGEKLRIAPAAVSAKLTIRSADETYTIRDGIPISVDAPVSLTDAYRVVVNDDASVADITVTGPKQAIALIRDKGFFVKATLEVTNDDVTKSDNGKAELSHSLKFTLPDGVTPTESSKLRTVQFRIVKRDNAG